jgi:uncharacterized protein YdhG (YjbR/CyaY superfamily)
VGDDKRRMEMATLDEAAQDYIDHIAPEHRPLFDRIHRLIVEVHPEVSVSLSYKMPAYTVGNRRLSVGTWKHGLSIYGARHGTNDAFTPRHPALKTSKGTLQIRPEDAVDISDDDFRDLVHAALDA